MFMTIYHVEKIFKPFGSSEFHLCSDPMGIHNIYINCFENFVFFNPSNSMNDFLKYVESYQDFIVYPNGVKDLDFLK